MTDDTEFQKKTGINLKQWTRYVIKIKIFEKIYVTITV